MTSLGETNRTEVSLLDIVVILADRKRLILWVTLACALSSAVLSLLLPVRYTATVTLLPPPLNSQSGALMLADLGGTSQLGGVGGLGALANSSMGFTNPNDKYAGMLTSRIVEDAVINRLSLMKEYRKNYLSDTRKVLEERTEVNGDGKDGLLHVSVEDADPRRAVEIANSYVDQFRELSQHLAISEASQRRQFFEQQLAGAKNNLADAEEAMKRAEQTTGLIQLNSQAQALISTAASLRAQIAAREMIVQGMQTYATGQNSQLIQANEELKSLRAQLTKLSGSQGGGDGLIMPKGLVPEASLEYVRKLRDVKYYETIFEILARQFELAKLEEVKAGAIIQIVDPATLPDKRSFPKRSLIVIGGTVVGFFAGIFLVLAQAELKRIGADLDTSAKITLLKNKLTSQSSATISSHGARVSS